MAKPLQVTCIIENALKISFKFINVPSDNLAFILKCFLVPKTPETILEGLGFENKGDWLLIMSIIL